MTRKEFTKKSESINRIFCLYLFVCLATVLGTQVVEAFLPQLRGSHRFEMVQNILLGVFGVGGVCGMAALPYFLAKKWKVVCPACGNSLIERTARAARLTGKCPKCQGNVFSPDATSPQDNSPRLTMTREQFKAKADTARRNSMRRGVISLITVFICTLIAGFLGRQIQTAVDQGQFDYLAPSQIMWIARGTFIVVVITLLAIPLLGMVRFKTGGVPCPECHRPLFGRAAGVATETGICVYCGCRLFEASFPVKTS